MDQKGFAPVVILVFSTTIILGSFVTYQVIWQNKTSQPSRTAESADDNVYPVSSPNTLFKNFSSTQPTADHGWVVLRKNGVYHLSTQI